VREQVRGGRWLVAGWGGDGGVSSQLLLRTTFCDTSISGRHPLTPPHFRPFQNPHPHTHQQTRAIPEQQLLGAGFSSLVNPILEPLASAVQPFPPTATSAAPLKEKLPLVDRLATLLQSLDQQAVAAEALRRCAGLLVWFLIACVVLVSAAHYHGIIRLNRSTLGPPQV
jgi:hypothetical protein